MDINDYVFGNGVITPEQQRAIAGSLRNRDNMGAIMALSGDRAVAPVGQAYMETANKGIQQGLTHNYYQGMLRSAEEDRALRLAIAKMNRDVGMARTAAIAARANQTEKPIRKDLKDAVQFSVSTLQSMDRLEKEFDPKWVSSIPGMGVLKKWGARVAPEFMGDEVLKFAAWHSALNREIEAGIKNKLYGSALTAQEIKSWRDMTIDPAANMVQIKAWFDRNKDKMREAAAQNVDVAAWNYPQQTALLMQRIDPSLILGGQAAPQPMPEDDPLAYEVLPDEE